MNRTHYLLYLLILLFAGLVFMPGAALASGDDAPVVLAQYGEEEEEWEEEEDAFGGIMHTSLPMISDVTFTPAQPEAGQPVTVSCKVVMSEQEEEEATVKSVQAGYTSDGKTIKYVDLAPAGEDVYSGTIPGQPAGAEVTFFIRAVDTTRNVATEIPFKTTWPASKANMVPGAVDIDNSEDIVPDDLDYMDTYFGYDDENLYVGFHVQGNVTGGTMDPPYIQVYGAKFTNPDTDQGEGLMVGKLVIYVPMGKELAEKFKEELDKVGFKFPESRMGVIDIQKIMSNPKEGYVEAAAPEGKADGGFFVGRFKKVALGDNPSGYVRGIFLTAANASLDSFMPIPLNATPYTQLYFRSNGYTVAGAPAAVATKAGLSEKEQKRLKYFLIFLAAVGITAAVTD
ncbi:MAG: hypothetical protein AB1742_09360 [bacterium]